MRRISTLLEVLLSAALFILGLYLLHAAISAQSEYGVLILVAGAVSFALGQSILWHRRMLRRSVRNQKVDRSKREYSFR